MTGLDIGETAVAAVRYESDRVAGREPADLVVDAMGRASRLSAWLESSGWEQPPARDFLALQRVIVDAAWQISAGEDRTGPDERERMPLGDRLARRIVDLIIQASITDAPVNTAFQEVTQMLRHPSTLATPSVVWRAWRARKNPLPAPTPPLG